MAQDRSSAASVALYNVKIQAFPVNLHVRPPDHLPEGVLDRLQDACDGIHAHALPLKTLTYNDMTTIAVDLDPDRLMAACQDKGELEALRAEHGYQPVGARFLFLQNGSIVAIFAMSIPEAVTQEPAEELLERGTAFFRGTKPVGRLLHRILIRMEDLGIVEVPAPVRYDILEAVDEKRFCEEMEWRAWASNSHIALGPDADRIRWPHSVSRGGGVQVSEEQPRVATIGNNYLGWSCVEPLPEHPLDRIQALVEPIGFLLCQRSLSSSALRNMRTLSEKFAYGRDLPMSVDRLHRYVALVRTNLMAFQVYEESSDKTSRAIYNFMYDHLGMPRVMERLDQALETISTSISGLEVAYEERFQRRISLTAVVFTGLTFVSVITGVASFIDYQHRLFDLPDRAGLVAVGIGLSLLGVGLLGWALRLGRPFRTTQR